jgi:outer membrane protein assembly factor BamB
VKVSIKISLFLFQGNLTEQGINLKNVNLRRSKLNKNNKISVILFFALFICISLAGSVSAADDNTTNNVTSNITTDTGDTGLADSPYPTYQVNNQRTGQSNYTGPETNTTDWTYTIGSGTSYSAIGSDGTIYCGVSTSAILTALNTNGTVKWTSTLPYNIRALGVGSNDILYVTTQYALYALDSSTGTTIWAYNSSTALGPELTIASDGTIYLKSGKSPYNIYAISSEGQFKWNYTLTGAGNPAGIAIAPDGTIYVPCYYSDTRHYFYALNPDGSLKWISTQSPTMQRMPVIGSDGTIYITSWSCLYAYAPNGTLKWSYACPDSGFYSAPSLASDGTLYIETSAGVYALTDNGTNTTVKWSYTISSPYSGLSILIGADGTIYT